MEAASNTHVAVVGGGLVGALEACFMAKRGFKVDLYEYRKDIRTLEHVPGKSINLAMSVRGLSALNEIGLGNHIAKEYGIPMRARMVHNEDGTTYPVPYGTEDQCIYSVGRRYVNEILLTAGEKFSNLRVHFEHKLAHLDVDTGEMSFSCANGDNVKMEADFVLGCDGAFSAVRRTMMKKSGFAFDFSQEYIPHDYLELCIPPTESEEFAMAANFLHIWPRGTFMMIALPNQDKSFTVTLFMPRESFSALRTPNQLIEFFKKYFADSIPLIGKDRLVEDFFSTRPSSLLSVKCKPYNWKDKVLLLGDAAHAMVPFYGQGMNCGMEDVLVLDGILNQFPDDRLAAFEHYSEYRHPDAHAICDLALYNYIEMRDLVAKPSFLLRKRFDNFLHWLFPKLWVPLYTSVTFTRMRYHLCIANRAWQDKIVDKMIIVGKAAVAMTAVFILIRATQRHPQLLTRLQDRLHLI